MWTQWDSPIFADFIDIVDWIDLLAEHYVDKNHWN